MADKNRFRSDEEMLEAIRRNQELMKEPEGFNFEETLRESWDAYHTERSLSYSFSQVIFTEAHREDGWWSRLKIERSFKHLEHRINHIQNCPKCEHVMAYAGKAMEYIKIVPMIVTREDGEKALRHLAKINNISEEDFRKWMNETSDRIIKEMNEADKPKTD